jgi:hypothetical protein
MPRSAGSVLRDLTLSALAALTLILNKTEAKVLRGSVDRNTTKALENAAKDAINALSELEVNNTATNDLQITNNTDSNLHHTRVLGSGATPTFEYPTAARDFYDYPTSSKKERVERLGEIDFGPRIQAGTSFGLVVQNTNKLVIEYSDNKGNWLRINYINPPFRIPNHPETAGSIGGFMTASFKEGIFLIASHGKFLTEAVSMGPTRGKGSLLLKLEKWNYDGAPVIDVADPNPSQGSNYWYEAAHGYDGGKTYDFNKNYWGTEQIEWKSQDTGFNLGYIDSQGRPLNDPESKRLQRIIEGLEFVRIGTPKDATVSLVRSTLDTSLGVRSVDTASPTQRPTTGFPTQKPTQKPTTGFPTKKPTRKPTTGFPTQKPTLEPTTTFPTKKPTPKSKG